MELLILLIFYIAFGILLISIISKLLMLGDKESQTIFNYFILLPFLPIKWILIFFKKEGFMSCLEQIKLFKISNRGFVIDGNKKRLSREASFANVLITGGTGSGKSTAFLYSNIFTLSRNYFKNSLIILDPKSELITKTSGYLKKHSYEVYSLNPLNLNQSIYYNPLANVKDDSDIDKISRIIVNSMYDGHIREEDKFWINGAISIIFVIIHCLVRTKQKSIITLPNVLHCINNFHNIEKLVSKYASAKVFNIYQGILVSHENVLLSFLSTAKNSLLTISINPNIEKLLTKNTFDFKELRERRIALFINIPPTMAEQTAFLTSLFYTELFDTITPLPNKKQGDIYCLFDEFGQYKISQKLPIYMTFLRASRVAFLGVLQDYKQLVNKYGINNAETILNGGVSTKIYFAPNATSIAQDLSKRIGQKKIKKINDACIKDDILSLSDIVTLKRNEVLFFHSNYKPIKLKIKRFFEISRFKIYSKLKPYIKTNNVKITVSYIDLRSL